MLFLSASYEARRGLAQRRYQARRAGLLKGLEPPSRKRSSHLRAHQSPLGRLCQGLVGAFWVEPGRVRFIYRTFSR